MAAQNLANKRGGAGGSLNSSENEGTYQSYNSLSAAAQALKSGGQLMTPRMKEDYERIKGLKNDEIK